MKKYSKLIVGGIILLALMLFGLVGVRFKVQKVTVDTTFESGLTVKRGRTLVAQNGATITVKGDTVVDGAIACQSGPLNLVVSGNLTVTGKVECNLPETLPEQDFGRAISFVVSGSTDFTKSSEITANGTIELTDDPSHRIRDAEALDKLFVETGLETDDGSFRIGPFSESPQAAVSVEPVSNLLADHDTTPVSPSGGFTLARPAYAQAGTTVIVRGHIIVSPPPPGKNSVVLVNGPVSNLILDATIEGPDGRDGKDRGGSCHVDVPAEETRDEKQAKHGLRFRARAQVVTIGTLTLKLGSGGKGGNATTNADCYEEGFARGGNGGESGNIKITASRQIKIIDEFRIIPGKGGNGGHAKAFARRGKDGNPGKKGGGAEAHGGKGAPNEKTLSHRDVQGIERVSVGSLIGGDGGDALAKPNHGGNGIPCDSKGGDAGKGSAEGGKGGKAKLVKPESVGRTPGAKDQDGKDGNEQVTPANRGKDGPPCGGKAALVPPPTETPKTAPTTAATTPKAAKTVAAKYANKTSFEFLGGSDKSQLSYGSTVHIIVASGGDPDITKLLPIKLKIVVDGKTEWEGTISAPAEANCRDATGCSMNGPSIPSDWKSKKVDVEAYDSAGELMALYRNY
ncbi:hypothetical protein HYZ64_01180 [Candidatus Berkelbacteria bacterium]|nr:hypothetical protein [Candidatus Berkelbacteria bacterium]